MEEQGAAAAAARRCTAEVHGWHALGSCGLLSEEKLVRHRAAVAVVKAAVAEVVRAATDLLFTVDLGCRLQLTWISSEHFRNPRCDHSFQPATNLLFAATDLTFTATDLVFT